MKNKEGLYMALSGTVVGAVNGFFGGGGGMIILPLFTMLLGFRQKTAHATAIAVILPISIISAVIYIIGSGFEIFNLNTLYVAIGVLLGGIAGALILKKIDNAWLVKIFAVVMLVAGVKMMVF
ncbi:MAG: sulfite exporter TauE/SafE family protein [Clostridiales bacterium]|jgi:uncharacterized membrane protein YfcA|nr:sulfite exporter TauE/SafE family protein [Clostridiales bacterium]